MIGRLNKICGIHKGRQEQKSHRILSVIFSLSRRNLANPFARPPQLSGELARTHLFKVIQKNKKKGRGRGEGDKLNKKLQTLIPEKHR